MAVTGSTEAVFRWNEKHFCPECGSGNGYWDNDISFTKRGKNYCKDCKNYWKTEELLNYEGLVNFQRHKKLKDILE
jgi:hypothetical protein